MSKCKQRRQIEQRRKSGTMRCHRHKRVVRILVDSNGGRCADERCQFSPLCKQVQ